MSWLLEAQKAEGILAVFTVSRALPLSLIISSTVNVCIPFQHIIYSVWSPHTPISRAPAIVESWFSSDMVLLFVPTYNFVGLFQEHLMALLPILNSSAKNHKEWERRLVELLQMCCCDLFVKCCWKSQILSSFAISSFCLSILELLQNSVGNQEGC